jgi:hypothetical protein
LNFSVDIPEGMHLGLARDGDGFSSLLFDDLTNNLVRPVKLNPADKDFTRKALIIGLAVVAVAIGVAIVVHNRQRITRWWQEKIVPLLSRAKDDDSQVLTPEASPAEFATAIDLTLADYRANMDSEEAKRRLVALLAAAAFIADQMRLLASAHIEDDAACPELESAMARLATPQVTAMIDHMLQSNTSMLDESTSERFLQLFGGGVVIDGEYLPLKNDKVQEALRLAQGETLDTAEPQYEAGATHLMSSKSPD